jgi:hypothetical protein
MSTDSRGPRGPRRDPDNGRIFHNVALLTLILVAIIVTLLIVAHVIPGIK